MTPIFCCGFECGVATAGVHWTLTGGAAFETGIVRSGSRSVRRGAGSSSAKHASHGSSGSTVINICRFYVRFVTLPTVDCPIFSIGGSPFGAVLFKNSDTSLYAGFEVGLVFGSTGVPVTTGIWYRIDIKLDVTNNPWTCNVQIDGVPCGQATSATAGTTVVNDLWCGNHSTTCDFDAVYDDVITSQTNADYPIGAGYINHFVPTSDGTHNIAGTGDFQRTLTGTDILNATTTAFQLIDEIPFEATVTDWINMVSPPNATDYVECIFGPAPGINTPVFPPRAVEVICGINQAGTGVGNMEIRLNDNGTTGIIYTATGVAGVTVATGQQFKRAHFADPPSAASLWTVVPGNGNFNNVRVRFGSPAAVDANPDQYLGCAMIEAEFSDLSTYYNPEINQPYFQKTLISPSGQKSNIKLP